MLIGGGHTRQEDVQVSPTQSRISPSMQRVLMEVRSALPGAVPAGGSGAARLLNRVCPPLVYVRLTLVCVWATLVYVCPTLDDLCTTLVHECSALVHVCPTLVYVW